MAKELIGNQTASDIYQRYSESPAGQILSERTRWDRFKPENISNETWIRTLSIDADNFKHCLIVYGITDWFISKQNCSDMPVKFTDEERKLLLFTALSHDIPEGITSKGDVPLEYKTNQDEQKELAVIEQAIIDVLNEDCNRPQIATQVKDCLDRNKPSKLGHAFEAIENIGYFRTAIIAWKNKDNSDPILATNLKLLTNNVFINSIPKLTEFSKTYFPIKKYLQDRSDIISQAFEMDQSYFKAYGPDDCNIYYQKFLSVKSIWQQWLQQNI
jgi:hypothetical protein